MLTLSQLGQTIDAKLDRLMQVLVQQADTVKERLDQIVNLLTGKPEG